MQALREYVQKGGGLLLVGNTRLFGVNSPYRNTPLEDVLPLSLEGPVRPGPRKFQVDVYEPAHPVMALAEKSADSLAHWNNLAPLEGNGEFLSSSRKGALVLAGVETPQGRAPLISAWQRGRGRVMMFLGLSSWRWELVEAGRGRGPWAYQRFWDNALRWLSASEDFQLVRLELPSEPVVPGEEALLRAFVWDENHRPLAEAEVRATVVGPQGQKWFRSLKSVGNGEYADTLLVEEAGVYRVSAQALHRQKALGKDEDRFQGGTTWEEKRDMSADFPLLEKMSQATGGVFIPLPSFSLRALEKSLESVSWSEERHESVWNSGWVFVGLLLLMFTDWITRRRWGGV
jgi:hypothetical protein